MVNTETALRRIADRECVDCGLSGMEPDDDGFPRHVCVRCQAARDSARVRPEGYVPPAKWNKQHRDEGLSNLDRLMGVPDAPVVPIRRRHFQD